MSRLLHVAEIEILIFLTQQQTRRVSVHDQGLILLRAARNSIAHISKHHRQRRETLLSVGDFKLAMIFHEDDLANEIERRAALVGAPQILDELTDFAVGPSVGTLVARNFELLAREHRA